MQNHLPRVLVQPVTDPVMNIGLHYDSAGNISTYRDIARQQKILFSYDSLDRLITATVDTVNHPAWWDRVLNPFTETYSYTPIGNFISKAGITQYYSGTKPHAVTSLSNGASFTYDANGNMTQRVELSGTQWVTYTQGWDIDNKLIAITSSVGYTATYAYDADGTRVKRVDASGTLLVVGAHFEVQTSTGISTSYYFFDGQRVAMRQNSAVYWLHGDHLGSASLTTNITGAVVSEMRYYPFGETRWVSGTIPSDRTFTGQRSENPGIVGSLMDYGARMYSPSLGRFISPDSIVPGAGNPQALNRYSYTYNRPLSLIDSDGHFPDCLFGGIFSPPCMAEITMAASVALDVAHRAQTIMQTPKNESVNRASEPTSLDMTGWLVTQMKSNATSPTANAIQEKLQQSNYEEALSIWVSMVKDDAPWDFKHDTEHIRRTTGATNFTLGGMSFNHQMLANIHYGFVGRAAGFSSLVLHIGAGAAQVNHWGLNSSNTGPIRTFFDDPFDSWSISFGVFLYEKFRDDISKLTEAEFSKWLQEYIDENGNPPTPLTP